MSEKEINMSEKEINNSFSVKFFSFVAYILPIVNFIIFTTFILVLFTKPSTGLTDEQINNVKKIIY